MLGPVDVDGVAMPEDISRSIDRLHVVSGPGTDAFRRLPGDTAVEHLGKLGFARLAGLAIGRAGCRERGRSGG